MVIIRTQTKYLNILHLVYSVFYVLQVEPYSYVVSCDSGLLLWSVCSVCLYNYVCR